MHYKQNNKETKTYVQGLRPFGNTLPRGIRGILRKNGYNYSEIITINPINVDALELICRVHHKIEPKNIQMTELDSRGFFMQTDGVPSLLYTSFGTEIDADDLRVAMVKVTKKARMLEKEDA